MLSAEPRHQSTSSSQPIPAPTTILPSVLSASNQDDDSDSGIELDWKFILAGLVSGLVIGVSIGEMLIPRTRLACLFVVLAENLAEGIERYQLLLIWDGVDCDDLTGHVIGLNLERSCLYGSVHSNNTLFHLVYLQKLNLNYNNFNFSPIPTAMGIFSELKFV
ncbi:hypothetical protein G4B88_009797 [Cannabis sativa]|uniref:Uncharacterized protein n=1 Tax=Cannabis sativa TaxID=3483 RepID=A0A7J6E2S0_CANSA|nr:hypothetical protein G4B88_009797 [Cannabis sativa]